MPGDHHIEALLQQIRQKRNGAAQHSENGHDNAPQQKEFLKKFDELHHQLVKSVSTLNTGLAPENIQLRIVESAENSDSNRKAVQVVLTNNGYYNLLENPYLLIEGYVNNGDVRIVKNGAHNPGYVSHINSINPEILQHELSNFLIQAF
jgi:hypothetical protein